MQTGNRRTGRTMLIVVCVALLLLMGAVVWARRWRQVAPVQKPIRQQTLLEPDPLQS